VLKFWLGSSYSRPDFGGFSGVRVRVRNVTCGRDEESKKARKERKETEM